MRRYIDNAYNTGLKAISINGGRQIKCCLFLEKEITSVLGDEGRPW